MRGKTSEQNVNWKETMFIASNYITWQDKKKKDVCNREIYI